MAVDREGIEMPAIVEIDELYKVTSALEQIAFELKMMRTIAQCFVEKVTVNHVKEEARKFYNED